MCALLECKTGRKPMPSWQGSGTTAFLLRYATITWTPSRWQVRANNNISCGGREWEMGTLSLEDLDAEHAYEHGKGADVGILHAGS